MDDDLLSIGDFSRMTYLSVKALRHYHETGLLAPAWIDPATSYRFYRTAQVTTAQLIRRFRDLGMPLEQVRTVLMTDDLAARNRVIITHLEQMEQKLQETQEAVASVRTLLQEGPGRPRVTRRHEPVTPSLAIVDTVDAADAVSWWMSAFQQLHAILGRARVQRIGPDGAIFADSFFTEEKGEVTAFVPVLDPASCLRAAGVSGGERVIVHEVPAADLAVVEHEGPFSDLDRTYGELGVWVTEQALAAPGPVRERYEPLGDPRDLLNHRTSVCWPIGAGA
jgi:DNA-binding transcriptional MerR regulator/effector-binding domain-containing protein